VRSPFRPLVLGLAGTLLVAACASGGASPSAEPVPTDAATTAPSVAPSSDPAASEAPSGTLTVYAGRSEELVGPLIERFEAETGVDVEVAYAGTTDLAATILEEGDASPADVFFAQDAGALGAVAAEGRLTTLPSSTLDQVDARFRSDDGQWVGLSGRARVVVYDTRLYEAADLPASIDAFTDPAWSGKIGWAPTNASFQSFVTAYRVLEGDEAARTWLEGIVANEPKVFEGNGAVLAAVAAGEVEVGFINHYYLMNALAEQGDTFPVRNHFIGGEDPGALVNAASAGILSTAKNAAAAQAFVDYLLNEESQEYFANETHEYPLIEGVAANPDLPALDEVSSPDIDLSDLSDLEGTLRLIQEAGVL
jgi:iron(III) transport system substrate-binding protein